MRTDTSSDEFAVKVLDITQDGEMSTVGDSTTPMQRWASVAVLVALAAGLLYGFFLGRGDRPAENGVIGV